VRRRKELEEGMHGGVKNAYQHPGYESITSLRKLSALSAADFKVQLVMCVISGDSMC
jgi:hypothetical protein